VGTCGTSVYNREIYNALYIYRFEIMILVHVKAKNLLCCWAVRDLGIGMDVKKGDGVEIKRFYPFRDKN